MNQSVSGLNNNLDIVKHSEHMSNFRNSKAMYNSIDLGRPVQF